MRAGIGRNTSSAMSDFIFHTSMPKCMCVSPAGLDVDRVSREMDFQALQQNIANVTYCNIEAEVRGHTDPLTVHVVFVIPFFRSFTEWTETSLNSSDCLSSSSSTCW